MKKLFAILFLLLFSSNAHAQSSQYIDQSSTYPRVVLGSQAGLPTCGTGCTSIAAGSSNSRGSTTTGSAVTSITVNFSTTLSSTPFCVIGSNQDASLWQATVSSTTIVIVAASAVTSKVFTWVCSQ